MADTTDLTVTPEAIISLINPGDDQPSGAAVYLASLTTDVSRAGMASHLRTVARFISPEADPGRCLGTSSPQPNAAYCGRA